MDALKLQQLQGKVPDEKIAECMKLLSGGYGYKVLQKKVEEFEGEYDNPETGESETFSSVEIIHQTDGLILTKENSYSPFGQFLVFVIYT